MIIAQFTTLLFVGVHAPFHLDVDVVDHQETEALAETRTFDMRKLVFCSDNLVFL